MASLHNRHVFETQEEKKAGRAEQRRETRWSSPRCLPQKKPRSQSQHCAPQAIAASLEHRPRFARDNGLAWPKGCRTSLPRWSACVTNTRITIENVRGGTLRASDRQGLCVHDTCTEWNTTAYGRANTAVLFRPLKSDCTPVVATRCRIATSSPVLPASALGRLAE